MRKIFSQEQRAPKLGATRPLSVTRRLAIAFACSALALAACGPVKRVNPPAATVQGLTVLADGNLALDLRLQNHSDVETRFGRLEATLDLEGRRAGSIDVAIDVVAAPHSVEIVKAELALDAAASAALQPSVAAGGQIRYRIEGRITTAEPGGKYPLEYESRLSPVPGRAGEYR